MLNLNWSKQLWKQAKEHYKLLTGLEIIQDNYDLNRTIIIKGKDPNDSGFMTTLDIVYPLDIKFINRSVFGEECNCGCGNRHNDVFILKSCLKKDENNSFYLLKTITWPDDEDFEDIEIKMYHNNIITSFSCNNFDDYIKDIIENCYIYDRLFYYKIEKRVNEYVMWDEDIEREYKEIQEHNRRLELTKQLSGLGNK